LVSERTIIEDVFIYENIIKKARKDSKNIGFRASFTPSAKKLLKKAIEWKELLESGKLSNQAEIARIEGVSRVRVTQIMSLLRLAPEIQEHILSLPETTYRCTITERSLRPITQIDDQKEQLEAFQGLI